MSAPTSAKVGFFFLVRHLYPAARWSNPAVPEHAPNWIVSLKMPGWKTPQRRSSKHEICAKCLAAAAPTDEREDCRCQAAARKFGDTWLQMERAVWTGKRTEAYKGERRSKSTIMLAPVFATYAENGPKEAAKQAREARYLLEQATGLPFEEMTLDLLLQRPREIVLKWATMRQLYAERGWSLREGKAPADAWQRLRAEFPTWKQKTPDRETVRPVNTTITGAVASLKSIFSKTARTNYLPGLDLPPTPKLDEIKLALPKPRGFKQIPAENYRAMHEGMEALRNGANWGNVDGFKLWTALQLCACMGPRTVELQSIKPHWLETVVHPSQAFTIWTGSSGAMAPLRPFHAGEYGTFVVLKNRPEEGFWLKARHRAEPRRIRLPWHVVQAIRSIQTDTSIYGLSPWKTEEMIKRGSEWIRQFIPDGKHTWYWFRKLAGSIRYREGDTREAGALLGHAPGSNVTAGTYIGVLGSVDAITPEQLHPDNVKMNAA